MTKALALTASDITKILEKQYSKDVCFAEVKDGPTVIRGHYRIDFLAISRSWSPVTIKAFEIKISHSDFVADKKWTEYYKLCNQFYWVCPKGLINKAEIDAKAGLIYIDPLKKTARTVKRAVYRKNDPDPWMLLYLIFWKLDQVEQIKKGTPAWRQMRIDEIKEEMKSHRDVGESYKYFVSEQLSKAQDKISEARSKARDIEREAGTVLEWFRQNGINEYEVKDVLDNALIIKNLKATERELRDGAKELNKLADMLKGK